MIICQYCVWSCSWERKSHVCFKGPVLNICLSVDSQSADLQISGSGSVATDLICTAIIVVIN
jgi:hypothetical protein